MTSIQRRPAQLATMIVAALALSACATSGSALEGPMDAHVHNLSVDGERLLIGTHEGLWQQLPGQDPSRVSQEPFDVMGFAQGPERWYASGHPGPGMDAPGDLGLLASDDEGKTWQAVSLSGEVDFHRLAASGDAVVGISAHDGRLLRSEDAGETWTDLGTPPLFDIALDPNDPEVLIGTTEEGPVRSTDGGRTIAPLDSPSLLALLAWSGDTLFSVDVQGQVHTSTDAGTTWVPGGALPGQASALAAEGRTVAVQVGDAIHESRDGGDTFEVRIPDLAGH
jgi:photosystem II stability/assembly factor-like uncharacterized protein